MERRQLGRGQSTAERIGAEGSEGVEGGFEGHDGREGQTCRCVLRCLRALLRRLRCLSCLPVYGRALFVVTISLPSAAQTTEPTRVTPLFENVTRVESWSFFRPPPSGGDPDYTLLGNRATLGVRVDARRLSIQGSLRYAQLVGLPREAMGPGPLGPGAQYYAAVRTHAAYQLYIKSMSLRVKNMFSGLSLEAGRMAMRRSGDRTPFAGRLIGNADWTIFRTELRWRARRLRAPPLASASPHSSCPRRARSKSRESDHEQRVARTLADGELRRPGAGVQLLRASLPRHAGSQGAARQHRPRGRRDRCRASRRSAVSPSGNGYRAVVGLSRRRGEHCSAAHGTSSTIARRASMVKAVTVWLEHGMCPLQEVRLYATGDDNPADDTHGTFFPMLPTTTPALLGATYAQMNLRRRVCPRDRDAEDVADRERRRPPAVARVTARPLVQWHWRHSVPRRLLRLFHAGLTPWPHRSARSSGGSAQVALYRNWSVEASLGVMKGGEVVQASVRRRMAASVPHREPPQIPLRASAFSYRLFTSQARCARKRRPSALGLSPFGLAALDSLFLKGVSRAQRVLRVTS